MKLLLLLLLLAAGCARADGLESQHPEALAAVWAADAVGMAPPYSFETLARTPPELAALPPEAGRTEVPEPASAALLLVGMLGLAVARMNLSVKP